MASPTRAFVNLHVFLYRITNGRIGARIQGRDVLLLKTVGRKTGKLRTTPVVYTRDGDSYLITGGAAGIPKHPAWYWNATAESSPVAIQIREATLPVRVEELHGDERAHAYEQIKRQVGRDLLEGYERKAAGRVFPVLRLTPQAS